MTLVNPQSEVIFKSKLNWESCMTGSMCLHSAALGGMCMEKFKGQTCFSKHKGKKNHWDRKAAGFSTWSERTKGEEPFGFFTHKDQNKRGMQSQFFPPTAITFDRVRELSRIFAEVFWIRHFSHPCRSFEHVSVFHITKLCPFSTRMTIKPDMSL